ncbi:hypothetical protein F5B17DRAFT_443892 [Nemania serpens]|nr:hypothetical protein F5B17DRAFT_443892 [Nemania serpens]
MASCPERHFKDPRDMLRHLKKCDYFQDGKFWCPTCDQVDSFKVVSNKKCSWDRVNMARKLIRKSLKILQSIAGYQSKAQQALGGSLCVNCLNAISRNGSFGSSQGVQPKFPTPPTGYPDIGLPKHVSPWELWDTSLRPELYQVPLFPESLNTQGPFQHPSYSGMHGPGTSAQQISPSELSAGTLGPSIYSSDISSASASHTNDSPALDSPQVFNNNPVATVPILPTRQMSRRGHIPSLTVDTHQSLPGMLISFWESSILVNEGETLGHSSGIDSAGIVSLTPKIITPQESENNSSVPNRSLTSPENTHLHPSPSVSFLTSPNLDFSPSPMSSAPELQCDHAGCDFKPKGKTLLAYLRKHMKVHQKNKIPCPYCRVTFSRRDNLTAHIRRIHATFLDKRALKRRREYSGSPQPRAR